MAKNFSIIKTNKNDPEKEIIKKTTPDPVTTLASLGNFFNALPLEEYSSALQLTIGPLQKIIATNHNLFSESALANFLLCLDTKNQRTHLLEQLYLQGFSLQKWIYRLTELKYIIKLLDIPDKWNFFHKHFDYKWICNHSQTLWKFQVLVDGMQFSVSESLRFYYVYFLNSSWLEENINLVNLKSFFATFPLRDRERLTFFEFAMKLTPWIEKNVNSVLAFILFANILEIRQEAKLEFFKIFAKNWHTLSKVKVVDKTVEEVNHKFLLKLAPKKLNFVDATSFKWLIDFLEIAPEGIVEFYGKYFDENWTLQNINGIWGLELFAISLHFSEKIKIDFFEKCLSTNWKNSYITDPEELNKLFEFLKIDVNARTDFFVQYFDKAWAQNHINFENFSTFIDILNIPYGMTHKFFEAMLGTKWLTYNHIYSQTAVSKFRDSFPKPLSYTEKCEFDNYFKEASFFNLQEITLFRKHHANKSGESQQINTLHLTQ